MSVDTNKPTDGDRQVPVVGYATVTEEKRTCWPAYLADRMLLASLTMFIVSAVMQILQLVRPWSDAAAIGAVILTPLRPLLLIQLLLSFIFLVMREYRRLDAYATIFILVITLLVQWSFVWFP